jgi:hypothetical protein
LVNEEVAGKIEPLDMFVTIVGDRGGGMGRRVWVCGVRFGFVQLVEVSRIWIDGVRFDKFVGSRRSACDDHFLWLWALLGLALQLALMLLQLLL